MLHWIHFPSLCMCYCYPNYSGGIFREKQVSSNQNFAGQEKITNNLRHHEYSIGSYDTKFATEMAKYCKILAKIWTQKLVTLRTQFNFNKKLILLLRKWVSWERYWKHLHGNEHIIYFFTVIIENTWRWARYPSITIRNVKSLNVPHLLQETQEMQTKDLNPFYCLGVDWSFQISFITYLPPDSPEYFFLLISFLRKLSRTFPSCHLIRKRS